MKYKLLCSDLDGTLLSTKSDVSKATIAQINRLKKKMRINLVSARMPSGMRYIQEDLGITDQPIICYNGALVKQEETVLHSVTIPPEIARRIYILCEPLKIDLGLYTFDEWHVPQTSERVEKEIKYTKTNPIFKPTLDSIDFWRERNLGVHKIMLMGTKTSANQIMPVLQSTFDSTLNIYRSNDTLIEIAPKSVSKLSAIKKLLKPNESLADVIAFGDNYNDMEMLEQVGCGVAVANGREEVKQVANAVTLKNTEDGVAHYLARHLSI